MSKINRRSFVARLAGVITAAVAGVNIFARQNSSFATVGAEWIASGMITNVYGRDEHGRPVNMILYRNGKPVWKLPATIAAGDQISIGPPPRYSWLYRWRRRT